MKFLRPFYIKNKEFLYLMFFYSEWFKVGSVVTLPEMSGHLNYVYSPFKLVFLQDTKSISCKLHPKSWITTAFGISDCLIILNHFRINIESNQENLEDGREDGRDDGREEGREEEDRKEKERFDDNEHGIEIEMKDKEEHIETGLEEGNEEKVEDYDNKDTIKEVVDEGKGVEGEVVGDYDNKDPMKEGVEVVEEGKELEKGKVVEEEEEGNNLPNYDEKNKGEDDGLDPIQRQKEEKNSMNEIKENQVN